MMAEHVTAMAVSPLTASVTVGSRCVGIDGCPVVSAEWVVLYGAVLMLATDVVVVVKDTVPHRRCV